jgi:hypothetical protein
MEGTLQDFEVEEAQSTHALHHGMGFEVAFSEEMDLELANLLRAQFLRRAVEVFSKLLDGSDVGACGSLGVIPALEFLEPFFWVRQKKSWVDSGSGSLPSE